MKHTTKEAELQVKNLTNQLLNLKKHVQKKLRQDLFQAN